MSSSIAHPARIVRRPEHRLLARCRNWFATHRPHLADDVFADRTATALGLTDRPAKRVADVAEVLGLLETYVHQHEAVTALLVAEVEERRNAESPIRTCPDCELTYHAEFQSPVCPHHGSL